MTWVRKNSKYKKERKSLLRGKTANESHKYRILITVTSAVKERVMVIL